MEIKLYTTKSCPFCIAAKNLLKAKKLEFKEINKRLLNFYLYLLDGLVLAAKMAVAYFKSKENMFNY